MEANEFECFIAAILTIGSLDNTGHTSKITVDRYREMLAEIRKTGGAIPPMAARTYP